MNAITDSSGLHDSISYKQTKKTVSDEAINYKVFFVFILLPNYFCNNYSWTQHKITIYAKLQALNVLICDGYGLKLCCMHAYES